MEEKQTMTTALSQWSNAITDMVVADFTEHGEGFSDYSKTCALNAMSNIYDIVKANGKDMNNFDTSNLRSVVGQCAGLQLNANAFPKEVYFQTRSKKVGNDWVQQIEMGVESAGLESIMRKFGVDVKKLHDWWIVREGDEFVYPHRKGLEVTPPEWEEKGLSQKVSKVVLPVEKTDGSITYLITERESVQINLKAHVKNNLMNETFGICKDRYNATTTEKKQIAEKKQVIYDALDACATLDEMLSCEIAKPYISDAWLNSSESMIITKLKNNTVRKYPKEFSNIARRSFLETDEVYKASVEEVEENANTTPFDDVDIIETTATEIVE